MFSFFFALLILASPAAFTDARCDFPAVFNFGASSSDTGGFKAAFPTQRPPYGMTYFGKPVGRASDGRLVIDFIAQGVGLPFLSPYLQSIGSNFTHGANFASSAATILVPNTSLFVSGTSPFYLTVQVNQMKEFMTRVLEISSPQGNYYLPPKDIFNKSLYIFDIGQNDFTGKLATIGIEGVKRYFPQMISQLAEKIKMIYNELGGRTFMVFNLAPVGCYPAFLSYLPHNNTSDFDMYGCAISYNNLVLEYNKMLKDRITQTRNQLSDATLVYVDTHAVKLDLFQHPKDHGLVYGTKACCGYGGEYNYNKEVHCGATKVIDGKQVTAAACKDPENYVSWDGVHTTDAANKLIALGVLNGSFSDPIFPFSKFCDLKPVG